MMPRCRQSWPLSRSEKRDRLLGLQEAGLASMQAELEQQTRRNQQYAAPVHTATPLAVSPAPSRENVGNGHSFVVAAALLLVICAIFQLNWQTGGDSLETTTFSESMFAFNTPISGGNVLVTTAFSESMFAFDAPPSGPLEMISGIESSSWDANQEWHSSAPVISAPRKTPLLANFLPDNHAGDFEEVILREWDLQLVDAGRAIGWHVDQSSEPKDSRSWTDTSWDLDASGQFKANIDYTQEDRDVPLAGYLEGGLKFEADTCFACALGVSLRRPELFLCAAVVAVVIAGLTSKTCVRNASLRFAGIQATRPTDAHARHPVALCNGAGADATLEVQMPTHRSDSHASRQEDSALSTSARLPSDITNLVIKAESASPAKAKQSDKQLVCKQAATAKQSISLHEKRRLPRIKIEGVESQSSSGSTFVAQHNLCAQDAVDNKNMQKADATTTSQKRKSAFISRFDWDDSGGSVSAMGGSKDDNGDGGDFWENVQCFVCAKSDAPTGNDLALCDGCNRAFHQTCHNPAIVTFGPKKKKWFCCDCHVGRQSKASSSRPSQTKPIGGGDPRDEPGVARLIKSEPTCTQKKKRHKRWSAGVIEGGLIID